MVSMIGSGGLSPAADELPHHHKVFAAQPRSYRDLPLRLAEYGQHTSKIPVRSAGWCVACR